MTQIANVSKDKDIYVALVLPSKDSPPSNGRSVISPMSNISMNIRNGTMRLYVWNSGLKNIWSGMVPTKIRNPLAISPERKEVMYDGYALPSDSTDMSFGYTKWLCIIALIIVICIVLWYIFKKKYYT